jgi:hypothetical protein
VEDCASIDSAGLRGRDERRNYQGAIELEKPSHNHGDTDHGEGDRESKKRLPGPDEERLACFFRAGSK